MASIPMITIERADLVVDELVHKRRLFRKDEWLVVWRSKHRDARCCRARVRHNDRSGTVRFQGRELTFHIRWCEDRRRPIRFGEPAPERPADQPGMALTP